MSVITMTKLYELLAIKLDKEIAENLTNFIEQKISTELENKTAILATKEDLANTNLKISESKVDLIKWIFAFWITIVLMFIGLYLKN
jgi:hypothetical protein